MALRVLMADESSTIKRVIQLALQDFAVEVKSVPVGLDVLPVTKAFKPDLIFADVLLPKRSGYDVCKDLKSDAQTKIIPVILMWSGFMELDEAKFSSCGAEGKLEKPFETEQLRHLVTSLVPKLNQNPVSAFLKFPRLPDFEESAQKKPQDHLSLNQDSALNPSAFMNPDAALNRSANLNPEAAFGQNSNPESIFTLPELNPDEEFQQVPLHMHSSEADQVSMSVGFSSQTAHASGSLNQTGLEVSAVSLGHDDENWSRKDLSKFKIQIPEDHEPQTQPNQNSAFSLSLPEAPMELQTEYAEFSPTSGPENSSMSSGHTGYEDSTLNSPAYQQSRGSSSLGPSALDLVMAEKVLREEAQKMLEGMLWKILPEIAERIVKEEINKLLQETEKSI